MDKMQIYEAEPFQASKRPQTINESQEKENPENENWKNGF